MAELLVGAWCDLRRGNALARSTSSAAARVLESTVVLDKAPSKSESNESDDHSCQSVNAAPLCLDREQGYSQEQQDPPIIPRTKDRGPVVLVPVCKDARAQRCSRYRGVLCPVTRAPLAWYWACWHGTSRSSGARMRQQMPAGAMFQPYRFCNASYHTIPVRHEHGAPVRAKEFNITQQSVACLLGAGPPAGSYSSRKNKLAGTQPSLQPE